MGQIRYTNGLDRDPTLDNKPKTHWIDELGKW